MSYIQNFKKFTKSSEKVDEQGQVLGPKPQDTALAAKYDELQQKSTELQNLKQQVIAKEQELKNLTDAYNKEATEKQQAVQQAAQAQAAQAPAAQPQV